MLRIRGGEMLYDVMYQRRREVAWRDVLDQ